MDSVKVLVPFKSSKKAENYVQWRNEWTLKQVLKDKLKTQMDSELQNNPLINVKKAKPSQPFKVKKMSKNRKPRHSQKSQLSIYKLAFLNPNDHHQVMEVALKDPKKVEQYLEDLKAKIEDPTFPYKKSFQTDKSTKDIPSPFSRKNASSVSIDSKASKDTEDMPAADLASENCQCV